MKKSILFALFALFVFLASSGGLWAQDSDRNFFKSIALVYSISTDRNGGQSQAVGLAANFFIFSKENFGYYISPGIGLRTRHGANDLERIDVFFDAAIGPAFRIYEGDEVDVLAGIGPDVSCTVHLREFESDNYNSTETFLGIGLGGSFETRLKMHKNIAFAGGILMKDNFSGPYIGIGF